MSNKNNVSNNNNKILNIKEFVQYLEQTLSMFDKHISAEDFEDKNSDVHKLFTTLFSMYTDMENKKKIHTHTEPAVSHSLNPRSTFPVIDKSTHSKIDHKSKCIHCGNLDKTGIDTPSIETNYSELEFKELKQHFLPDISSFAVNNELDNSSLLDEDISGRKCCFNFLNSNSE